MNIALFGKGKEELEPAIKEAGFSIVDTDPDIVLSYGGDGTFLKTERVFPGIPKVLIKNSPTCKLCTDLPFDEVLNRLKWKDYTVHKVLKLKVLSKDIEWYALNDVVIHNQDPRHAIRFNIQVGSRSEAEVIGDGVVIATTFGSTGYYQSVTQTTFNTGIGVAFNNVQTHIDSIILPEDEFELSLDVIRGPALVYVDNQTDEVILSKGDTVQVTASNQTAQVLIFD